MSEAIQAAPGVWSLRTLLANVVLVGADDGDGWVLVDAGIRGYDGTIRRAAGALFGPTPPRAVVLTHGHFDHVGCLDALLAAWDVPVYAHTLEFPHLTARVDYPPPDPLAGGGLMAWSARLFPRGAIDLGPRLLALAEDGSVPGLPEWRWIATPGHSTGHVSLFRERDRTLVAGDAVITVKQESFFAVLAQHRAVHGPPAYFTTDWDAARTSVEALAALRPETLITGHGLPMHGPGMREALANLSRDFDRVARPAYGRYSKQPARLHAGGALELPPDPLPRILAGAAAGIAAGVLVWRGVRRRAQG